jgi:hypothetical protein
VDSRKEAEYWEDETLTPSTVALLARVFGGRYRDYLARTRRWL